VGIRQLTFMNTFKKYFLANLLILPIITSFAQNVETYFENQQPVPYEKLYLHTDREFYFESDTLWFAAYLVNGQEHIQNTEACNLYVDLIDNTGKVIQDELFIIQNGLASGHIILGDLLLSEGVYLLRAYTDYQRNFGDDAFFTKAIRVSDIKSSLELAEEKVPPVLQVDLVTHSSPDQYSVPPVSTLSDTSDQRPQLSPLTRGTAGAGGFEETPVEAGGKIDISFLPEGGFLLVNNSNCVAFKAILENGKGVKVSGKLFDEQNNPVLNFQSLYKGAGKFFFFPKAGKNYYAKIDGSDKVYQLPEVKETGAKLKMITQHNEIAQMMVHGNGANLNFPYYLTLLNRGKELFLWK